METWIIYVLKANAVLTIFFLCYRFLFKRLTFYRLNRFYFLLALAVSFIHPAADWSQLFESGKVPEPTLITQIDWSAFRQTEKHSISYWSVMGWTASISSGLLFIWFLFRLLGIFNIHRRSLLTIHPLQPFRSMREEVNPFSFWQSVYINPTLHSDSELSGILLHEQIHIREWHTLDVLLTEVAMVFCWFNPAAWLF